MAGFDLTELGTNSWQPLWTGGGFPCSFFANDDQDSVAWREGFIRTFLQRDIPQVGASWESFAMEQIVRTIRPLQLYYWATYSGAELDILFIVNGKRYGIEFKFSEAPEKTKSMAIAIESLELNKLLIVYPGEKSWLVNKTIVVCPIDKVEEFLD